MAIVVASSCASSINSGATLHSSLARTRGGNRLASFLRSISQSGCAYEPTNEVGSSTLFIVRPSDRVGLAFAHGKQAPTAVDPAISLMNSRRVMLTQGFPRQHIRGFN